VPGFIYSQVDLERSAAEAQDSQLQVCRQGLEPSNQGSTTTDHLMLPTIATADPDNKFTPDTTLWFSWVF
jgi:hypothetical protein